MGEVVFIATKLLGFGMRDIIFISSEFLFFSVHITHLGLEKSEIGIFQRKELILVVKGFQVSSLNNWGLSLDWLHLLKLVGVKS